jgi:hypothetical protein
MKQRLSGRRIIGEIHDFLVGENDSHDNHRVPSTNLSIKNQIFIDSLPVLWYNNPKGTILEEVIVDGLGPDGLGSGERLVAGHGDLA